MDFALLAIKQLHIIILSIHCWLLGGVCDSVVEKLEKEEGRGRDGKGWLLLGNFGVGWLGGEE